MTLLDVLEMMDDLVGLNMIVITGIVSHLTTDQAQPENVAAALDVVDSRLREIRDAVSELVKQK